MENKEIKIVRLKSGEDVIATFTENKKEGIKILKRLGFKKKTIEAFIENIIRCYEDDEEQMVKEIMMGKVPKRLLN